MSATPEQAACGDTVQPTRFDDVRLWHAGHGQWQFILCDTTGDWMVEGAIHTTKRDALRALPDLHAYWHGYDLPSETAEMGRL